MSYPKLACLCGAIRSCFIIEVSAKKRIEKITQEELAIAKYHNMKTVEKKKVVKPEVANF